MGGSFFIAVNLSARRKIIAQHKGRCVGQKVWADHVERVGFWRLAPDDDHRRGLSSSNLSDQRSIWLALHPNIFPHSR